MKAMLTPRHSLNVLSEPFYRLSPTLVTWHHEMAFSEVIREPMITIPWVWTKQLTRLPYYLVYVKFGFFCSLTLLRYRTSTSCKGHHVC